MQIKIIYHQIKPGVDCPDGLAAAWVAHKAYPEAEVIGCWYQCSDEELPVIEPGDLVVIVDFSFPKKIIKEWERIASTIILLDHHKTAEEMLGGVEFFANTVVRIDQSECGATLTWRHFFSGEKQPAFLCYIKDRDLWNFNYTATEGFHEICSIVGRSFELFDFLATLQDYEIINCIAPLGDLLLAPKRKQIAAIAERATITTLTMPSGDSYSVPLVELAQDGTEDRLVSDVCAAIYNADTEEAYPFVIAKTSDGAFSLRSDKKREDGGFDVSAIAKAFGGGGHRNAAGFKIQDWQQSAAQQSK